MDVSVPFQRPEMPPLGDVDRYLSESFDAAWFSNFGPNVTRFETWIADRLGRPAVTVANCTLGLSVALRAATLDADHRRDLVVVPSYTFAATPASIVAAGFEPLFIDIEPDTLQPSLDSICTAFSRFGARIAAIMATSTFGTPDPRFDLLADFADDAGVPIVLDSAAAFGTPTDGHRARFEVFSFHATKPLPAGEGGAIVANNADDVALCRAMTNFGFNAERVATTWGINAKMSELAAAAALASAEIFDVRFPGRRRRAELLIEAISPRVAAQVGHEHSAHQVVPAVCADSSQRAEIEARCALAGVMTRRYYDTGCHQMPAFASAHLADDLPVTADVASRMMSLPMANDLSPLELATIAAAVLDADVGSLLGRFVDLDPLNTQAAPAASNTGPTARLDTSDEGGSFPSSVSSVEKVAS